MHPWDGGLGDHPEDGGGAELKKVLRCSGSKTVPDFFSIQNGIFSTNCRAV